MYPYMCESIHCKNKCQYDFRIFTDNFLSNENDFVNVSKSMYLAIYLINNAKSLFSLKLRVYFFITLQKIEICKNTEFLLSKYENPF